MFNAQGEVFLYTMRTCSGTVYSSGRRAKDFLIFKPLTLRYLLMILQLTFSLGEILSVHTRPANSKMDPTMLHMLNCSTWGWVIIGDVCFVGAHKATVSTFKTSVLENGRPSFLTPCQNSISFKERFTSEDPRHFIRSTKQSYNTGKQIFKQTSEDNMFALSGEDEAFLDIMDYKFTKDKPNSWVAPLPFRCPREYLPNNRDQAVSRLFSLHHTLEKKADMKDHYVEFMETMFKKGPLLPPLKDDKECWYLPSFGIYHPQKLGKIRIVFDSSAQYNNISLNQVLLKGPDLNNNLIGVIIRFRSNSYAVMADIEQMFHSFLVKEEH